MLHSIVKKMHLFLIYIAIAACAIAVVPQCRWACDDPVCNANCVPVCALPVCQIQCNTGHSCSLTKPNCYTTCPANQASVTESCPQCETTCLPLNCPGCQPLCEAPVCSWHCSKPSMCMQPRCELMCERPACEAPSESSRVSASFWMLIVMIIFAMFM